MTVLYTHREALHELTSLIVDALDGDGREAILRREGMLAHGMTVRQWRTAIMRNKREVEELIIAARKQ
jgi:hypothetical protein